MLKAFDMNVGQAYSIDVVGRCLAEIQQHADSQNSDGSVERAEMIERC